MPTYQYTCTSCAEPLEVVQRFSDDPLTECPKCAGRLRKVFSPVGVVFKGSGFYRNDSRSSNGSGSAAAKNGETQKKDAASTDSASTGSKDSSGSNGSGGKSDAKTPAASSTTSSSS